MGLNLQHVTHNGDSSREAEKLHRWLLFKTLFKTDKLTKNTINKQRDNF
jgi:hypothetical protein